MTIQIADALTSQYGACRQERPENEDTVKQTEYKFKVRLYTGVDAEMILKVESE